MNIWKNFWCHASLGWRAHKVLFSIQHSYWNEKNQFSSLSNSLTWNPSGKRNPRAPRKSCLHFVKDRWSQWCPKRDTWRVTPPALCFLQRSAFATSISVDRQNFRTKLHKFMKLRIWYYFIPFARHKMQCGRCRMHAIWESIICCEGYWIRWKNLFCFSLSPHWMWTHSSINNHLLAICVVNKWLIGDPIPYYPRNDTTSTVVVVAVQRLWSPDRSAEIRCECIPCLPGQTILCLGLRLYPCWWNSWWRRSVGLSGQKQLNSPYTSLK